MRGFVLAAMMLASALTVGRASEPRFGAWLTYWDRARGLERLESAPSAIDDVFFFDGVLSLEGVPRPHSNESALRDAIDTVQASGKSAWLTIVNDVLVPGESARLKDANVVHQVLQSEDRRRRHVQAVVGLARRLGVSGIDIDYENLEPADREAFVLFVEALAESDLRLSVTVQPKTRDVRSRGAGAMDWSALCPNVDRLQIMLYNLHSTRTGPGPIATPDWIESVLAHAAKECPRERMVPVLKLSGMDWGPSGASGIQYREASALAAEEKAQILRDEESGVPYFHYNAPDGRHTVFFEDAESIDRKIERVRGLGFDTVVLWSLGREDPEILDRLGRDRAH